MSVTRRFLLASSLARLIEKERGGHTVRQGYFPDHSGRSPHVQLEGSTGQLILVPDRANGAIEEVADIPRSHAEALLDVAAGKIDYLSIGLDLGFCIAAVHRFTTPGPLDLITLTFKQDKQARRFHPLPWFGPEVTDDPSYQARTVALAGLPPLPEVEITSAALDSLLDTLGGYTDADLSQAAVAQAPSQPQPAEGGSGPEPEPDLNDLGIEDSIIRELARSLHPQRR
jgi:CYTH domain-containing protein